ncbi:uncharacterized protein BDV17DRAFT_275331 [Aspergillus undulatus]|uniref:uncharacterized protein n=1 Tax=Aspergillus undulatus TaxID=1810928 RepID=UPI003CCCAA1B
MADNELTLTVTDWTTYHPGTFSTDIGYTLSGSSVQSFTCAQSGYVFRTRTNSHAACCPETKTSGCNFVESCDGNVLVWETSHRYTCTGSRSLCSTRTIYDEFGASSAAWSVFMNDCMSEGDEYATLYWELEGPIEALTTVTLSESSSVPTEVSETQTQSAGSIALPEPSPTSPSLSDPTATNADAEGADSEGEDGGSGTNVGAIAGGVVGGVAGLALILAALWYSLRRKKKKDAELREIGSGYVAPVAK